MQLRREILTENNPWWLVRHRVERIEFSRYHRALDLSHRSFLFRNNPFQLDESLLAGIGLEECFSLNDWSRSHNPRDSQEALHFFLRFLESACLQDVHVRSRPDQAVAQL